MRFKLHSHCILPLLTWSRSL